MGLLTKKIYLAQPGYSPRGELVFTNFHTANVPRWRQPEGRIFVQPLEVASVQPDGRFTIRHCNTAYPSKMVTLDLIG